MNNNIIYRQLAQKESTDTSHNAGQKQVLLNGSETETNLTQVAFGVLAPNEIVAEHIHNDMEECFYFIEGKGIYRLNGEEYNVSPGTFIKIPANTTHELEAIEEKPLRFIYWGIIN